MIDLLAAAMDEDLPQAVWPIACLAVMALIYGLGMKSD